MFRPNTPQRSSRRHAVGLAVSLMLTLPVLADGSADSGHCHLERWTPDVATYLGNAGTALALKGDTAVYGVDEESAVYVMERQGAYWHETQRIESPSALTSSFGQTIALSENYLLIGDPFDKTKGVQAGAVFLYEKTPTGWDYAYTFYGIAGSRYGRALDIEESATGLQIAIGAPSADYAHLIRPYLNGWVIDYISEPDTKMFGSALDLNEETLVISDPLDSTTDYYIGAVYYYHLTNQGSELVQKIFASDADESDNFGTSVSVVDKGRLVVGASGDDEGGLGAGAVYVFDYTSFPIFPYHHFENESKIVPCDVGAGAKFGGEVKLDPETNRIAIGAKHQETGGAVGGAVHIYRPDFFFSWLWVRQDLLTPEDAVAEDRFGSRISIEGDLVLASSPHADTEETHGGAVYMFSLARKTLGGGQCPCDALAGATPYGAGKPGTLGMPQLSVDRPPIPGEATLFKLTNVLQGVKPFILWGSIQASIPFDGGNLYIGDPTGEYMPVVGVLNQVGVQWQIPADPALCGAEVFFQAMFIDPGAAGPFKTAQTNGLHTVIGY